VRAVTKPDQTQRGDRLSKALDRARAPEEIAASPEARAALAIGGGKAEALAASFRTARNRLKGLDVVRPVRPRPRLAGGIAAAGPSNPKVESMTNPPRNPSGAKGAPTGRASGGSSPFTEPTPGGKNKTVATLFGEIVWLFSQSPKHKNFFVSDLEWLVMTPILLKQFRVFYAQDRPIGVALWAYVNDEVEQRLMAGNARMAPGDWKSGEKLWLADIVAPFGGHDAMIKDLKEHVFRDREVRFLGVEDGKAAVKRV
jgi:cytolysin-activating lysine-acyltransferase